MKKITINKQNIQIISSFVIGIILASLCYLVLDHSKMKIDLSLENDNSNSKLVAKAGKYKLYLSEINSKLLQINPSLKFEELEKEEDKEAIIKEVLIQKLLLKNAIKSGSHKKYSANLKNFAITEVKENYLKDKFNKETTELGIKSKYDQVKAELINKKEYKISHILTKTKKDSYKALSALNNRSFKEVAQKFSIDQNSAKNGGDLGYVIEGGMIKEVEDKIKKLKKGQISKPIKTNLGWHIIELSDIRNVDFPEFDKIKENLKSSMFNESKQKIANDLIKDFKIEILGK